MFGVEPFLIKTELLVISESGSPTIFGPYVADLWAGGPEELSIISSVDTGNLLTGLVSPGDKQEMQFKIPAGLKRIVLTLCVQDGTEADMHLFDPIGNHTGFNYSDETVENQITDATYSGAVARTEYITLEYPSPGVYVLRVVGQNGPASFVVHKAEVSALPAVFTTEPQILGFGYAGQDVDIPLVMREAAGSAGVTEIDITLGDLIHELEPNNAISSDNIMVGDYSDSLLPNEQNSVPLTITIPANCNVGKYVGNIILNSSAGDHTVKVILQVLLPPDLTPPDVEMVVPDVNDTLQDGVIFLAEANDVSGVAAVSFYVREPNGGNGVPIGKEDLVGTFNSATGKWEYNFNTTQLPDGYYVVLAKAVDTYGNIGWSEVVPFSIRNWAIITLLPSTPNSKAGRTMPVKFSLRIAKSVDPAMPFVYNDELEIRIYDRAKPGVILQRSVFGSGSTNYRIDMTIEKYITNFKTRTTPATYIVEVWRPAKNFKVGSFTFATTK
jgi:hypothetical protein